LVHNSETLDRALWGRVMPSAHFFNDPDHWAKRAQEMRALAEGINDSDARASMLRVAAEYEKIAGRAQVRSVGNVSIAAGPKAAR
jgi:hypothetical protein